jgi:hypothetical protein
VTTQAAFARFLGRSANYAGFIQKQKDKGIVKEFRERLDGRYEIWLVDPELHARAREALENE